MNQSKANQLVLKSINQILDCNFFIPAYQRGYRWTETQVLQLLDDIWHFAENPMSEKYNKHEAFYCLQPIVVKSRHVDNKEWEVIDGQQRLTTIILILHYFNEMWIGKSKIHLPQISYETRTESSLFISELEIELNGAADLTFSSKDEINKILLKTRLNPKKNIDFSHIAKAYKTIHYWALRKGIDFNHNKLQSAFREQTKVIWYEADHSTSNNSIDIFTRLNIGKIPLTNAELIKALFLQKGNFTEEEASIKQIQIATEWDNIEKTLQDDAFWYFIYNPDNPLKYENRIEYIFDLIKNRTTDSESYHTFNEFYEDFTQAGNGNEIDIDKKWTNIKKYFLTFEDWFRDNELFHYIGYLIDCIDKPKNKTNHIENTINRINELKASSCSLSKKNFKIYLKKEIENQINIDIENIEELEFGDKRIKKTLLLFNILTILQTQKSDMRFPFNKYKSESWDIEHICSQTDKKIRENEHIIWVDDILEFFTGTSDLTIADHFIEDLKSDQEASHICRSLSDLKKTDKIKEEEFNRTFERVQKYFKEDPETEQRNDISNLALLDAATNRSYGNSFFPIKRKRIIENDSKGIFMPIATKNLFLKYYSGKSVNTMYWSHNDAQDYLQTIKNMLKDFFNYNFN